MKACIKCGVLKPLEDFFLRSSSSSVRRGECKSCLCERTNNWRKNNKEKSDQYSKNYRLRNPEKWKEICKNNTKIQYQKNPEKWKRYSRDWRLKNPERVAERVALWMQKNPDWWDTYRKKNAVAIRAKNAAYSKSNPAKASQKSSRYTARKLRSQPRWLTVFHLAQIEEMYEVAIAVSCQTGIKHHVDHIVPLRGKTVRGLHVPWNLQVIPDEENFYKSNKHPDDFYGVGKW